MRRRLFAVASAISLLGGCSSTSRQQLAFSWENPRPDCWTEVWRRPRPPDHDWRKTLEILDCPVEYVLPGREESAETLLKGTTCYVSLTPQEAADFTGVNEIRGGQAFLLRGIHSFPRHTFVQVHQQRDGDVCVDAHQPGIHVGPLGMFLDDQSSVPHAVVAWLERPPREVYVTFHR
jgi:hypothetical protein